jgi:ectoine hydroxylase-related dioxygenase (phytanoyl-CoA dioxygenase family)
MEQMLAVRLHLDDCGEENGPLQVLPGSHLAGRLDAEKIQAWRARAPVAPCIVKRGGVILMRPLLLHASSVAQNPAHRRVIHLEYAMHALPAGLDWLNC